VKKNRYISVYIHIHVCPSMVISPHIITALHTAKPCLVLGHTNTLTITLFSFIYFFFFSSCDNKGDTYNFTSLHITHSQNIETLTLFAFFCGIVTKHQNIFFNLVSFHFQKAITLHLPTNFPTIDRTNKGIPLSSFSLTIFSLFLLSFNYI
jgi:hypothetical protein